MADVHRVEVARAPIAAVVSVPGSKSIANRALVCAALADGESILEQVPDGDDTVAMIAALRTLGLAVGESAVEPGTLRVLGSGGLLAVRPATLDAALGGTTSRFLTAIAALGSAPVTIDGAPPLRARPMGPLHDALAALGIDVVAMQRPGHLPVTVTGPPGPTSVVMLPGDVSSQYVTALMLIAPYLPSGLRIELATELVSRPYVELTAAVMESFGVDGVEVGARAVSVAPGRYRAANVRIEPDASSASYPMAMVALAGGRVEIEGLTVSSRQGDVLFADLLGSMGCLVHRDHRSTVVERDRDVPLVGIDAEMSGISDLVPSLAVVAASASTPTRIRGVAFIRTKESDRIGDLAAELGKTGAAVFPESDGLAIQVVDPDTLHGQRLGTHHDHRLAMAFAALGAVVDGIEVEDPDVVRKSWPAFWSARAAMLGSTR